jgi:5-formyltetrahydrofolate cyclo-ligase
MNHREQRALTTEKRKLRETMMARRRALPHAAMLSAASSIARHFSDHPILAFAPSFAGYRAMRGELDVMEIFKLMARFNKQTALPCVTPEKSLIYRAWNIGDALTRHPLGMEEPTPEAPEITPAVILIPLLAFDGEGYRLGYGGGYYDRTMTTLRALDTPPLFIGVGFSMQEVEQVPTDENDSPLDGILTELGVSMF